MLPATQLQKRKAITAIATALMLLGVGLLAQRHESEAAHATEQSGRVVHAQELADHHEASASAHLHGREVHEHAGECTLLAMLHERVVHTTSFTLVAPIAATTTVPEATHVSAYVAIAAYRLAPKTSPPSA